MLWFLVLPGKNLKWGQRRIVRELKKLGIRISANAVRGICRESGLYPEAGKAAKKPPMEWTTFVRAHMKSIIACDFFTKRIYTLRGTFDAHILVFYAQKTIMPSQR